MGQVKTLRGRRLAHDTYIAWIRTWKCRAFSQLSAICGWGEGAGAGCVLKKWVIDTDIYSLFVLNVGEWELASELKTKTPAPPGLRITALDGNTISAQLTGDHSKLEVACRGQVPLTDGLYCQVAAIGGHQRSVDEAASNFALAFVDAMEPQDPVEALLCLQMATVHQTAMTQARLQNVLTNSKEREAAGRAMATANQTFVKQMAALKRHRTEARPCIQVNQVNVQEGGQAVVGDVSMNKA